MHLAALLGGWEILLILALVLLLFLAKRWRDLRDGFNIASDAVTKSLEESLNQNQQRDKTRFSIHLFIAQGFGIGRIPFAPGTFGSFLGLAWFAVLVSTGNYWAYLTGCIEGIAFSIWLCDDAEKIMGETDPGSVVLDEIIAIPFCFLPWVTSVWLNTGSMPVAGSFFSGGALWISLALVVLFRVFDIWKPWPVRQIQNLPGGWGVTADDVLAAVYVALISFLFVG